MPIVACSDKKHLSIAEALNLFCGYMASGRITGGPGGGARPPSCFNGPFSTIDF